MTDILGNSTLDPIFQQAELANPQVQANLAANANPNPLPATAGGDAFATLSSLLDSYGLSSLDPWVQQQLQAGASASQITLLLRQQPAFIARFPGIAQRQASGLPPISPTDYINYEDQVAQLWRNAGLPAGFHDDPATIGNLIGSDVSVNEIADRVTNGYQQALTAPTEVRQQLQNLYGIDNGHLAAFFLDPETATPLILQKFQAAQVAGTAQQTGFPQLGVDTATQLAALGLSQDAYRQGFTQLGHESQLFQGLPGTQEQAIGTPEQIAAQFQGNAAAQLDILRRQQQRQAAFQGGEQFTEAQTGIAGLGTAQRT